MNSICTYYEKLSKQKIGLCPDSIEHLPSIDKESEQNFQEHVIIPSVDGSKSVLTSVPYSETKEPTDMIPVIKMEYWDGSKFIVRTDKVGYKKILCKLRVRMHSRFLELPVEKQLQSMLKATEEMMSEVEYLKIKKE